MHKMYVLLMTSQIGIHEAGTGSSAHISNSVLGNSISVIVRLCLPFQFPCLLRSRISQYRRHYVASRMSIFRFLRWPVTKSFAFENTRSGLFDIAGIAAIFKPRRAIQKVEFALSIGSKKGGKVSLSSRKADVLFQASNSSIKTSFSCRSVISLAFSNSSGERSRRTLLRS